MGILCIKLNPPSPLGLNPTYRWGGGRVNGGNNRNENICFLHFYIGGFQNFAFFCVRLFLRSSQKRRFLSYCCFNVFKRTFSMWYAYQICRFSTHWKAFFFWFFFQFVLFTSKKFWGLFTWQVWFWRCFGQKRRTNLPFYQGEGVDLAQQMYFGKTL